jgi:hypothetical protein
VTTNANAVEVLVSDQRPDTIQTFDELNEAQRRQLAHDAWHVGLRALMNAYRQADEARLKDIGKTLSTDLDEQLRQHAELQEKSIAVALERYFDPQSGELAERLRQSVGEGGTLPRLLQQHLGPRNSILVETLTKHVGEESPLFRRLSPTDSEGLVCVLSERLRTILQQEHGEFQKALDPLCADGAVGRFITKLREELERADDDQGKQLKIALAALDTSDEGSLLNQLRRETQQARTELLQAINPAHEGSPLAVIRTSLNELLSQHAKSTREQLEEARKQAAEFQRDVRDAVQRIETKRREDQRSARGGGVFEDAVAEFTQRSLGGLGYVVDTTGNVVGLRPSCKVGDVVIQFPADHAFAGNRVVIEAKRDKGYTISRALDEIANARKNRDAGAGIFVLAQSHAAAGFQTFARYGQDIVVVWDDENPRTDPFLQAALMVALGLATRSKCSAEAGDLQALQAIEQRITQEIDRLEKIRKSADTIRRQADLIEKETGVGEKKLAKMLDDAKKTLGALNVELRDEELERVSPIEVDVRNQRSGAEVVPDSEAVRLA